MSKTFRIETPRGVVYTTGGTTSKLEWNPNFVPEYQGKFSRKQAYVDHECIIRMTPETPRRTGVLIKSAELGTVIGSGRINQIAPYARRQYYEHKSKSYWFERMKNRHKDSILRGAQKLG